MKLLARVRAAWVRRRNRYRLTREQLWDRGITWR